MGCASTCNISAYNTRVHGSRVVHTSFKRDLRSSLIWLLSTCYLSLKLYTACNHVSVWVASLRRVRQTWKPPPLQRPCSSSAAARRVEMAGRLYAAKVGA